MTGEDVDEELEEINAALIQLGANPDSDLPAERLSNMRYLDGHIQICERNSLKGSKALDNDSELGMNLFFD